MYDEMQAKLIGRNSDSHLYDDDSSPSGVDIGAYWIKFQKKFTVELHKLCGIGGKQVAKLAKVGKHFFTSFPSKKIYDRLPPDIFILVLSA